MAKWKRSSKTTLMALILALATGGVAEVLTLVKGGKESAVAWETPVTNEDGTPLTDLAGYIVGVFAETTDVTVAEPAALYLMNTTANKVLLKDILTNAQLTAGTYFIAVRALDDHGNASVWSDFLPMNVKVVSPDKVIIQFIKRDQG